MGAGKGNSGGAGFKASNACGDVLNEILTRAETLGGGWFGWVGTASGYSGRAGSKSTDACGDVLNEILTRAETLGGGWFGWLRTKASAVDLCSVSRGDSG